ncbi:MAG TPA: sorbosone dehydrogenase family protein [Cyclobacteriaceae bacterium]|nr:sorbosone dehydrogenase family protein [Cyclobacteriaceae bacterium]
MLKLKFLPILSLALLMACGGNRSEQQSEAALTDSESSLPLHKVNLPPGFKIDVFAEVHNARSLAMSPSGTIFVGNRNGDKVYAVKDTNGDFKADETYVIASGLRMPNGVAFRDGDLYVAEVSRILRFRDIEAQLDNPPAPEVVYDAYPTEGHHGWKYIAFGPDGLLYVPVGAPCNICEPAEIYATITRIDVNSQNIKPEIFTHGVRNTVGFTWHPETAELWFTDNGRDMMGDDIPPCELNHAPVKGMHFGYPYCHGGTIADTEFGHKRPCSDFTAPAQNLGPHTAPLGLKFYTGDMFPAEYKKAIIIAEHGSWNRSKKIGYRLSMVRLDGNQSNGYETFADGWMDDETQKVWGRPVDVLQLPDGSLLVSDDHANVIYRISYKG